MNTYDVEYLEFPITHLCSLHCDGCSAYANYALSNMVTLEQAEVWLTSWGRRVKPKFFRILGGEPFLNPMLPQIVILARAIFPQADIQVCTNGLNFDRHPEMPFLLRTLNVGLFLSVHSQDKKYLPKVRAAIDQMQAWHTNEGIRIGFGDNIHNWNRFYKGIGEDMLPFTDADPKASWEVCHSKHCVNLVDGRLWKCPQIGNLHIVGEKFGLGSKPEWAPYLAYKGLGLEATDKELVSFFTKSTEAVCGMCPSRLDNYRKDIQNVRFKMPGIERLEIASEHVESLENLPEVLREIGIVSEVPA